MGRAGLAQPETSCRRRRTIRRTRWSARPAAVALGTAPLQRHPLQPQRRGVVRHLPRAGQAVPGRPAGGQGVGIGTAPHDAGRRRRPQPLAVLGRPQGQPVVAGARAARGRRSSTAATARGMRIWCRPIPAPSTRRSSGRCRDLRAAERRESARHGATSRSAWAVDDRRPARRTSTACSRTCGQGDRRLREEPALRRVAFDRYARASAARRRERPTRAARRRR